MGNQVAAAARYLKVALRLALQFLFNGRRAMTRVAPLRPAQPIALREQEDLAIPTCYDKTTVDWVQRVLAGDFRPPFPPTDPEAHHDTLRLRGVLPALGAAYRRTSSAVVASRLQELLSETAKRADRQPWVGWDATTSALRLISLLETMDELGPAYAGWLFDKVWLGNFIRAHRFPIAAGSITEPRGNHQFINIAGQAAFGLLLQRDSPLPQRLVRKLDDAFARQFLSDGGHIERAAHYHLQTIALASAVQGIDTLRHGWPPRDPSPAYQRARHAISILTAADGRPIRFADAGRTFSGKRRTCEVREIAQEPSYAPRSSSRETANAVNRGLLPDFGCARWDWNACDIPLCLCVDVGPLGLRANPGHGHADVLSFCLYVNDNELITDPGTYLYANTPDSLWFKSPEAHNTITWPHAPAFELRRFFRWRKIAEPPRLLRRAPPTLLEAGYKWTRGRHVYHHRRTWRVLPRGLAIIDSLQSSDASRPVARLLLHPRARVRSLSADRTVVKLDDRCMVLRTQGEGLGPLTLERAWYAQKYAKIESTAALRWCLAAARRQRVLTTIEIAA